MADWTNLYNRFNDSFVSRDNLSAAKKHLEKFLFIGGPTKGIVDLKLDIIGEETLTADCDVTDHYVESNIAYQDQISLKPKIYTINGEVGELVWYQKDSYSQSFGQVAQRLEGVISFLPVRSRAFDQMKTKVMKAAQWVDTVSNAASKIANLSALGDSQQQAFIRLMEFRDGRFPISIQTPWGILENYVITNMSFTQPQNTKDKSLISITFKEFRTTSISELVDFDPQKYYGNAAFENQPLSDIGVTDGLDVSISEEIIEAPAEANGYKEVKKYIAPIELEEEQWYYKMEWSPSTNEINIFDGDNMLVTDDYAVYPLVMDAANNKIADNIKQGIWRRYEY